jgi:hypothetical protein
MLLAVYVMAAGNSRAVESNLDVHNRIFEHEDIPLSSGNVRVTGKDRLILGLHRFVLVV